MGMIGTRSEQQSAVYAAEGRVQAGRQFVDHDQAQMFVDSITASDWWTDCYPDVRRIDVVVQREDAPNVAADRSQTIGLNSRGLNERVILHEMAHVVTPGAGHTAPWVRERMNLTYRVLGSERYMELYEAFRAEGVDLG